MMFGIVGTPAVTANAPVKVTTSPPVVTVTLVAPSEAATVIDTGTVRLVAVAVLGAPAVTALLANVTTDELLKCVNWPVIVTDKLVWPCGPEFGLTDNNTGVPAVTVKPLDNASISLPVVRVTARMPVAAVGSMLTIAVAFVGELTVSDTTVIPAPKLAAVVPWTQFVN